MAESVRLIDPHNLDRNPENPRLIFHQDELEDLQDSIALQGILVPLTVYQDGKTYKLLDGERRWLCALKLGLSRIPVIVQPKPDRMQNIMLMFATHKARRDWDPLPTALKLEQLEQEFTKRYSRRPTEKELAGVASLRIGEVRRLKKLLRLPKEYRDELIEELNKPRSKQELKADHVIEATVAVDALRKKEVIKENEEEPLRRAIIDKFRSGVINNTTAPRKLIKLGQAAARKEIPPKVARRVIDELINNASYSIEQAYVDTVERADFQHSLEQLATRVIKHLDEHEEKGYEFSGSLLQVLQELSTRIKTLIKEK
jgi:ParB/RepB/Spo0J family partition protein